MRACSESSAWVSGLYEGRMELVIVLSVEWRRSAEHLLASGMGHASRPSRNLVDLL